MTIEVEDTTATEDELADDCEATLDDESVGPAGGVEAGVDEAGVLAGVDDGGGVEEAGGVLDSGGGVELAGVDAGVEESGVAVEEPVKDKDIKSALRFEPPIVSEQ